MSGPSKFDDLTRAILNNVDADAVILIVFGGRLGSGACRAENINVDRAALRVAAAGALRALADSIERDDTPALMNPRVKES